MKQEKMRTYCKSCRKETEWIHHADLPYWICTVRGCNKRSKDPNKEEEKMPTPKKSQMDSFWDKMAAKSKSC